VQTATTHGGIEKEEVGDAHGQGVPSGLSSRQAARRQAVVDAALRLLAQREYEQIAVREVAESAGVALATLYHYFPSKEHLFAEVLVQWAGTLRSDVTRRPLSGATPARRLEEALLRSARAFERHPQLARLVNLLEISNDPFARDVLARLDAVTLDVYLALLPDLPRDDAVRVVRVADAVLDAALRAWSGGRATMREVRTSLSDAVSLLLPESAADDVPARR
jgi:TetR/AcrR family transcriptional regulator, cholesterol catabolism regulator